MGKVLIKCIQTPKKLNKNMKKNRNRLSLLGAFVDVVAHVHIVLRLGYLSIMRMLQEWLLVMTIA